MRVSYILILVLVAVVATIGFSNFSNDPYYKIGFVAGLSGKYSNLGVEERNGFVLAVDKINQSGGINGKKIRYEIRDDKNSKEIVKEAFIELIENGYQIIVGPATSYMATQALDVIHRYKEAVVISPTVSSEELKGMDDNFIRLDNTYDKGSMKTLVDYIYAKDGDAKSALLLYDTTNPTYSTQWAEEFEIEFAKIDGEVTKIGIEGSSDLFERVESVLEEDEFDFVVLVLNSSLAGVVAQKIKLTKPLPIYAAGWALSEDFIKNGGEAVEGAVIMSTFNPFSQSPRFLEFKKTYKEVYKKEPSEFATKAYDSVMIIKRALEENPDIKKLKDEIVMIGRFQGLSQTIQIDRFGDVKNPKAILLEVKDGSFVKAKP